MKTLIRGAGGGGGKSGGSSHTHYEAPDSLQSIEYARVIDVIGEGPIKGLVNGMQSIYLNDTPVQNDDGSFNFLNSSFAFRSGTATQSPVPGFPAAESDTTVSTQVYNGTPVVRHISDANVNACRVTVGIPALYTQDTTNGDIYGTSVEVAIDVNTNGGGWVTVIDDTISGKATARYQRSYRIPLTSAGPWDIRVRRVTADAANSATVNQTWWDTLTEITDYQLSYPNTAYMGINIDAMQFSSIPTRKYLVDLMMIQVPSNYDPVARTYTGMWDGTFVVAWSNNPAWVLWDMLTNTRYGLGKHIPASLTDKWALYAIAQYCDGMVPDGFGGCEPRYTLNCWINSASAAYDVLQSIVGNFRGMLYASGGMLSPVADMPGSPKALYTAANVIDGVFEYQGSPRSQRHSVVNVTWQNPDNMYQDEVESVPDATLIQRYGVRKLEIKAFGCTSRGQAHRMGQWALFSEQYDTLVTFKTGLDKTATIKPGDIIEISDPNRAGVRVAGRVAAATTTHIDLDAPVTLVAGVSYTIKVLTPDGAWNEVGIMPASGSVTGVDLVTPLPAAPLVNAVWAIANPALSTMQARVVSIKEAAKNSFEVIALQYVASKYDAIELGLSLSVPTTSSLNAIPAAPTGLAMTESLYQDAVSVKSKATWSWIPPDGARQYYVQWRRGSDNWTSSTVSTALFEVSDTSPGIYQIKVSAENTLGQRGPSTSLSTEVYGLTGNPSDLTGLDMQALNGFALLSWDQASDLDVRVGGSIRIKHSPLTSGATWANSTDIGPAVPGSATQVHLPLLQGTYLAKPVDSSGVEALDAAMIITTAPSVVNMNVVQAIDESTWLGAKSGVAAVDGILKLDSAGNVDDWPSSDDIPDWDSGLGVASSGVYSFAQMSDVGSVQTCRISSLFHTLSLAVNDQTDAWVDTDSRRSWDGADDSDTAAELQISTSQVDPALNQWSAWSALRVGDYSARAFRFQMVLNSYEPYHSIIVDQLSVTVDMPDRTVSISNIAVPATGTTISFSPPFMATPTIGVTGQGLQPGENISITARSSAGFFVSIQNASGVGVARNIDVIAKGYGGI